MYYIWGCINPFATKQPLLLVRYIFIIVFSLTVSANLAAPPLTNLIGDAETKV